MKVQNSSKGVYFTQEVQFKLKEIACRYHVTLKSLIPALLWYIANSEKEYSDSLVPTGTKRLQHVDIGDDIYDQLKIRACQNHMLLTHYINIALLDTFDEPYEEDTSEECVQYFYECIIKWYQESMSKC